MEDHAVLLCSLMIGFGLEAFVCIGTKLAPTSKSPPVAVAHAWVATVGVDNDMTFWDPLTGEKYALHNVGALVALSVSSILACRLDLRLSHDLQV